MSVHEHILIVTLNTVRARDLCAWLRAENYVVTCASSFDAARICLQMRPVIVITDLKLGAYNGLHLAVRAKGMQIPVLVLGAPDAFFEREATQLGTTYLAFEEMTREGIVSFVANQIQRQTQNPPDPWVEKSSFASVREHSERSSTAHAPVVNFPQRARRLRLN